ncbi:MAG: M2 family metallopeptidase, partial [Isosphaeraceae bacterium]
MSDPSPTSDRRDFLRKSLAVSLAPLAAGAARPFEADAPSTQAEADAFLAEYVKDWLPLDTLATKAAWTAATDVSEAHTQEQVARNQAVNEVIGAPKVIETVTRLLANRDDLNDLTVRQLEKVRLRAAEAPGSLPEVVRDRTKAEARQSAVQDSFVYILTQPGHDPRTVTPNEIDRLLIESRDPGERQAVWECSKTVGTPLREGILRLRDLRNQVARGLGFDSFFALQVADYGMTVPEMIALTDQFLADVQPIYEQLHTWAKYTLAARYQAEPPDGPIPAHWLTNRWAQNWPGLIDGMDMDAPFQGKPREFIVEQAERFYTSIGFPKLPKSFYEKSDLYPADPNSGRKKNSHASAWHIDMRDDVRSLMSIEPNAQWFGTAHHELGHIYYYMSYSTPKVPYLLRAGANRAFHEGVGDLIGVAASQRPYLKSINLWPQAADQGDPALMLLDAALDRSLTFMPFAAGTMTRFERDFYAGTIGDDQLNSAWWDSVGRYQGVKPPGPRPETLCDAATKTHINDDPAQYYDYAIGTVLKYQLHDHIARKILKQDPRECNYFGNAKVGDFLRGILSQGATRDWRTVLVEATGEGLT